jgi:hypothetical protein
VQVGKECKGFAVFTDWKRKVVACTCIIDDGGGAASVPLCTASTIEASTVSRSKRRAQPKQQRLFEGDCFLCRKKGKKRGKGSTNLLNCDKKRTRTIVAAVRGLASSADSAWFQAATSGLSRAFLGLGGDLEGDVDTLTAREVKVHIACAGDVIAEWDRQNVSLALSSPTTNCDITLQIPRTVRKVAELCELGRVVRYADVLQWAAEEAPEDIGGQYQEQSGQRRAKMRNLIGASLSAEQLTITGNAGRGQVNPIQESPQLNSLQRSCPNLWFVIDCA